MASGSFRDLGFEPKGDAAPPRTSRILGRRDARLVDRREHRVIAGIG